MRVAIRSHRIHPLASPRDAGCWAWELSRRGVWALAGRGDADPRERASERCGRQLISAGSLLAGSEGPETRRRGTTTLFTKGTNKKRTKMQICTKTKKSAGPE